MAQTKEELSQLQDQVLILQRDLEQSEGRRRAVEAERGSLLETVESHASTIEDLQSQVRACVSLCVCVCVCSYVCVCVCVCVFS